MTINNKNELLDALIDNPLALASASKELREDKDVALAAVKRYGLALIFVSDRLQEQTADHRRFALRWGVYFGRSAEDR